MTAPDPSSGTVSWDVPFTRFGAWMRDAEAGEPNDPNAVCLATADAQGRPSARMVLLKDFDREGFVFYTNHESRKGTQLAENPHAAMCFHWKSLERAVRIEGSVTRIDDGEADRYFASRPRGSQIGTWASIQSRPMKGRFDLEKRVAERTAEFGLGIVPRPPFWGGYRLTPDRIEFWKAGRFRLHERHVHIAGDRVWRVERHYP